MPLWQAAPRGAAMGFAGAAIGWAGADDESASEAARVATTTRIPEIETLGIDVTGMGKGKAGLHYYSPKAGLATAPARIGGS
jgi:hypothetical protein